MQPAAWTLKAGDGAPDACIRCQPLPCCGSGGSSIFVSGALPLVATPLGGDLGRLLGRLEGVRPPPHLELVPHPPHPVCCSRLGVACACSQVRLRALRSALIAAARPPASLASPPASSPPPPPPPTPAGAAGAACARRVAARVPVNSPQPKSIPSAENHKSAHVTCHVAHVCLQVLT